MAGPPVYAKLVWTHHSYAKFHRAFEVASLEAIVEAGEIGKTVAKENARRHIRTGATYDSIGFMVKARVLILYVGTLAGVFIEYGTKMRTGPRGRVQADPYLRPGMLAAVRAIPGLINRKMGRGFFAHPTGTVQSRTAGKFGPGV